jgi:hypothetical protein
MTAQIIVTGADPFYSQETTLEGVRYLLDFAYSQREHVWRLSISLAADGTELASGIKLLCGRDFCKYRTDVRLPPGKLVVLPNGTDDTPPDLEELGEGRRCELVYFPLSDVEAV